MIFHMAYVDSKLFAFDSNENFYGPEKRFKIHQKVGLNEKKNNNH